MTENAAYSEIIDASEHTASELIGLYWELEIVHIPGTLEVKKFIEKIPEYYGHLFTEESLDLACRFLNEKFASRVKGINTAEVREAILEAVSARREFPEEQIQL